MHPDRETVNRGFDKKAGYGGTGRDAHVYDAHVYIGSFAFSLTCSRHVRLEGNLGSVGFPHLAMRL
jgi:hypothetical protein